MSLGRLWRPRSMLFWQLVAFNLLSALCAWALRSVALTPVAFAVVAALALMNGLFGMLATWRLWALPPDAD